MIVIGVVVLAAALHACWNAIVKSIDDRLSVMAVLGLSSVLVCLPIALLAPAPRGAALPFLAGSIAVHGVYTLLLVRLVLVVVRYPVVTLVPLSALWFYGRFGLSPLVLALLSLTAALVLWAGIDLSSFLRHVWFRLLAEWRSTLR